MTDFKQTILGLAALIGVAGAAQAQEPPLSWGMTAEQVLAAVPDSRAVAHGESMDAGQVRVSARDEVGGVRGSSRYFFGPEGLSMIEFSVRPRDCSALAEALLEQRSEPVRISDQGILRLIIWHDEANDQRLRLLLSAGLCDLYREPLSRFRDIDLNGG